MSSSIASRRSVSWARASSVTAPAAAAANLPLDQAIGYEREMQAITFATEDAAEGRAAFAEKRTGTFQGR